jgi:hypothetical protein
VARAGFRLVLPNGGFDVSDAYFGNRFRFELVVAHGGYSSFVIRPGVARKEIDQSLKR